MSGIGIRAVGGYVPRRIVTNDEIEDWTTVAADHIAARTGITERRYAHPNQVTSGLAYGAVINLMHRYPDAMEKLGAIILATSTPDQPQPPTAAVLHGLLMAPPVPAWDINAVCSGGLVGVVTGAAYAAVVKRPVLVVAADRYSGIMDRADWRTVSLFGDGAGAVVLDEVPDGYGLISHRLMTDGSDESRALVQVPGGGTVCPLTAQAIIDGEHHFKMRGPEVRGWAFEHLPSLIDAVIADAGVEKRDVERWIFHQSNPRMLRQLTERMGIDPSLVPLTAPLYGNTGAASMLITLAESLRTSPLERDDVVVLAAIGGGMSAGAVVLRWW